MKQAWMIRCTGLGVIPGLVFTHEPGPEVLSHWHARDVARNGRGPDGTLRKLQVWAVPVCLHAPHGFPLPEAPGELIAEVQGFAAPQASFSSQLPEMTAAASGRVE